RCVVRLAREAGVRNPGAFYPPILADHLARHVIHRDNNHRARWRAVQKLDVAEGIVDLTIALAGLEAVILGDLLGSGLRLRVAGRVQHDGLAEDVRGIRQVTDRLRIPLLAAQAVGGAPGQALDRGVVQDGDVGGLAVLVAQHPLVLGVLGVLGFLGGLLLGLRLFCFLSLCIVGGLVAGSLTLGVFLLLGQARLLGRAQVAGVLVPLTGLDVAVLGIAAV